MNNMNFNRQNCSPNYRQSMNSNGGCCGESAHNDSQCTNRRTHCHSKCQCQDPSTSYNDPLCGMPLGMGYVPWQTWECIYGNYAEALCKGTIFQQLDLPFYGCIPRNHQCSKGGNL